MKMKFNVGTEHCSVRTKKNCSVRTIFKVLGSILFFVLMVSNSYAVPTIDQLKIGGNVYQTGDFVDPQPLIQIEFSHKAGDFPTPPGIATFNINGTGILYPAHITFQSITTTRGILSYQVNGPLPAGLANTLNVQVSDSTGIASQDYYLMVSDDDDDLVYEVPLAIPNPFNPLTETTQLTWQLRKSEAINLFILDLNGKTIYKRRFSEGAEGGSSGFNSIEWNGRDLNSGKYVPNGVYLGIIASGKKDMTVEGKFKIIVLKE